MKWSLQNGIRRAKVKSATCHSSGIGATPENVLIHLKNIYYDGELMEAATAKDFLAVQTEAKRLVKWQIQHYN